MNLIWIAFLRSFDEYNSISGEMITNTTSNARAFIKALKVNVSPFASDSGGQCSPFGPGEGVRTHELIYVARFARSEQ